MIIGSLIVECKYKEAVMWKTILPKPFQEKQQSL